MDSNARKRRLSLGWACLPLVALLLASCTSEVAIGQPAPEFTSNDLQGRELSLADLKGKVVLLNFWGLWCAPCRTELPELGALYDELKGQPFEILAINVGDESDAVARYLLEAGISFPVVADQGHSRLYGVRTYPTNVILDPRGIVRMYKKGYKPNTSQELKAVVMTLIARAKGE